MTAAVAAAANTTRAQQVEEEMMTPYSASDLSEGWEFKIIRSPTGRFRDPAFLRQALAEEAQSGWMLLEKFDDHRVRLKRKPVERSHDAARLYDPYRTNVGPGAALMVTLILVGAFAFAALILLATYMVLGPPHGR